MPTQGTWLECNGQSTSAYPALAVVVGANVPDYRGIFLRGLGSQTSTHYGTVTHSSATLGTLQGDAIRNIYGEFYDCGFDTMRAYWGAFSVGTSGLVRTVHGSRTESTPGFSFDASRVVPTANENRPVNRAVRYLIRAA